MAEALSLSVDDLRRVHPLWLARRPKWLEIQDVRNCCPSKKAYLPKGSQEFVTDYELRLSMTRWVPEAPSARNRLLGGAFAVRPDLTTLDDSLADWAKKVDRRGRPLLDWLETKLAPLLADFGSCPVLVERPPTPEGAAITTREDQANLGLLEPMVRAFSPLEVRNWETDSTGNLRWVLTAEESWLAPSTPAAQRLPAKVYRLWDAVSWYEWTTIPENPDQGFGADPGWNAHGDPNEYQAGFGEKIHEQRQGEHGLSVVPWVVFVLDEEGDFLGKSLISNSVELDLKRLLLDSDQTWDLWTHAHPVLKLRTKSKVSEVGLGSGALHLSPDKDEPEDAEYLQLSTASFEARQTEIEQVVRDIYRHVGVDPMGVLTGNQKSSEASGVARAWSFETSEGRHTASFRKRLEEGTNGILRHVAQFLGTELEDEVPLKFPERPIDEPAAETVEVSTGADRLLRKSPTARKLLTKRLAFAVLPDLTEDQRKKIEQEIETAPDDDPLEMDFGGPRLAQGNDPNAAPNGAPNERTPASVGAF